MPELPEVESTVKGLQKTIIKKTITDSWTDWPKYFSRRKTGGSFREFKSFIKGRTIEKVTRIGKNVILEFTGDSVLLIHQKMTGHLLVGRWKKRKKGDPLPKDVEEKWKNEIYIPDTNDDGSFLWDPKNRFVRMILFFKDGNMLALSDMRRFAKIVYGQKEDIYGLPEIKELGPDPTNNNFKMEDLKDLFKDLKTSRKIKQVLLDQRFLVGIGNIYADEILWQAKIHPKTPANKLKERDIKKIFNATKQILSKAIKLKGTSIDDYRVPTGEKGGFADHRKAYQMDDKKCARCGNMIKKIKVSGRGTHYCPVCQVLPNK